MKGLLVVVLILCVVSSVSAELYLEPFSVMGNDTSYTTYTQFIIVTETSVSGWTIHYPGSGTAVTDLSENSAYVDAFQEKVFQFASCDTVTHVFKIEIKDTDPAVIDIANGVLVSFELVGSGALYMTDDSMGTLDAQSEKVAYLTYGDCSCSELFRYDPLYARYTSAGHEPVAWCWQYQCHGDADNSLNQEMFEQKYRVYDADLTLLINNWKKTPETGANPACDFDHAEEDVFIEGTYSIYDGDLTILINNWKNTDDQLEDCPDYILY